MRRAARCSFEKVGFWQFVAGLPKLNLFILASARAKINSNLKSAVIPKKNQTNTIARGFIGSQEFQIKALSCIKGHLLSHNHSIESLRRQIHRNRVDYRGNCVCCDKRPGELDPISLKEICLVLNLIRRSRCGDPTELKIVARLDSRLKKW